MNTKTMAFVGDVSSKDTRKQIEQMATEISSHLQKIVGKEMARNVSYFKVRPATAEGYGVDKSSQMLVLDWLGQSDLPSLEHYALL